MPLFRKRKAQSKNYHEIFSFLMEHEKVIRELEADWKVTSHGWKLSDKVMRQGFRWGDLRGLLLTNRRLILMKKNEIVYQVSIMNIKKADWKIAGDPIYTYVPYLRIELKNGEAESLALVHVGTKKHPDEKRGSYVTGSGLYLGPTTRRKIHKWIDAINQLCGVKN